MRLLRFITVPTADLMLEALEISVTHGISAYDACYVALSHQKTAPLLTADQCLVNTLEATRFDV